MKFFVKVGLFVFSTLIFSGCATPKQWDAMGGSRSDGTVKLAYEYGLFEQPQLQAGQGMQLATQKCAAWGYNGAEPFGSAMSQCIQAGSSGCVRWRVSAEFQCLTNKAVQSNNGPN